MTWVIVVIVVILIIVLLGVAGAKSEKNKNITIQKKQEEKNEKINRIKNNDTVKSWCNEIVSIMLPIIKKEPHKDCSIEIKSEKEHFLVGYNFQMRYLTYSRSYVYKEEPDVLYKYNFAEHGLPELPFMLAFAGGTMLYVISDEVIPETHAHGHERLATYMLLLGFIVMLVFDFFVG